MPSDVKSFEFDAALSAFDLLKIIVVGRTTSESGQHVIGSPLLDEN